MAVNQSYLFIVFTINGLLIGTLFDFFRILRRVFKTNDFITCLEDIVFWLFTGCLILYSIFKFNNGEIRLYMFLGIFIGILMYLLLLSKYIINVSVAVLTFFKKIISKIICICIYPFKFIIKLFKKIIHIFIENAKKSKKCQKNY